MKMGGKVQTQYPRKNWSSLMLMNSIWPSENWLPSLHTCTLSQFRQQGRFFSVLRHLVRMPPLTFFYLIIICPAPPPPIF